MTQSITLPLTNELSIWCIWLGVIDNWLWTLAQRIKVYFTQIYTEMINSASATIPTLNECVLIFQIIFVDTSVWVWFYAGIVNVAAGFTLTSIGIGTFAYSNPLTSPFYIIHAVLACTAMLYPLSGFLADVWCGQFKAIMISLSCLFPSTIILILLALLCGHRFTKNLSKVL